MCVCVYVILIKSIFEYCAITTITNAACGYRVNRLLSFTRQIFLRCFPLQLRAQMQTVFWKDECMRLCIVEALFANGKTNAMFILCLYRMKITHIGRHFACLSRGWLHFKKCHMNQHLRLFGQNSKLASKNVIFETIFRILTNFSGYWFHPIFSPWFLPIVWMFVHFYFYFYSVTLFEEETHTSPDRDFIFNSNKSQASRSQLEIVFWTMKKNVE